MPVLSLPCGLGEQHCNISQAYSRNNIINMYSANRYCDDIPPNYMTVDTENP